MKRKQGMLLGAAVVALLAAIALGGLSASPAVAPSLVALQATGSQAVGGAKEIPECPEALGANPLGGPCVPRAMRDVPPDPGPENDKTLAGIDRNTNGVRDDIERYIAANYGDSPQRMAFLMQYARTFAPFVSTTMSAPAEALAQSALLSRANACGALLIGPPDRAFTSPELRRFDEWLDAAKQVEIQYLNTTDRLALFIRNEKLLAGQGLTLHNWNSVQAACDFPAVDRSAQPIGEKP